MRGLGVRMSVLLVALAFLFLGVETHGRAMGLDEHITAQPVLAKTRY